MCNINHMLIVSGLIIQDMTLIVYELDWYDHLICKFGVSVYNRNWLLIGVEIGWSIVCKDNEDDQCILGRICGSKCKSIYTFK